MTLPAPTAVAAAVGYIPAGTRRYVWVTTIADPAAPTSAELTAGTDVTGWVIQDGVSGFETTSNPVDNPLMSTTFTGQVPGLTTSASSSIRFVADTSSTDARGTFSVGDTGFVCIFPEGIVASNKMSVFPATVVTCSPENASGADIAAIMVGFSITSKPTENIAIPSA